MNLIKFEHESVGAIVYICIICYGILKFMIVHVPLSEFACICNFKSSSFVEQYLLSHTGHDLQPTIGSSP